MQLKNLKQISEYSWQIDPFGKMNVPVIIYSSFELIKEMDDKVYEQATNVATLPGIVDACYVMPDAHWGYGFPIGAVAAFDPDKNGIISAGGVGFDIACGVRTLKTPLTIEMIEPVKIKLANALVKTIPAGVGSTGNLKLGPARMDEMLAGGARWAVENGYGTTEDLKFIEESGCLPNAKPDCVSDHAKKRQRDQVGTLGSGNHYLELQQVTEIYDEKIADKFGLSLNQILISIHCGSRGLGHQIGTDYLKLMNNQAAKHHLDLPDRELACAPIKSNLGQKYLGAIRCGINCALANRQVLTHLVRKAVSSVFGDIELKLLYDVSHNTCKQETHKVGSVTKTLFVHRKGATRSFGPNSADLPLEYKSTGQPVLIGGTMETASYILAGTEKSFEKGFASSCHGAGRSMSRRQATKKWRGSDIVNSLAGRGILIKGATLRGIAEEAPQAYKDVNSVVDSAHNAELSKRIARLEPLICIKG